MRTQLAALQKAYDELVAQKVQWYSDIKTEGSQKREVEALQTEVQNLKEQLHQQLPIHPAPLNSLQARLDDCEGYLNISREQTRKCEKKLALSKEDLAKSEKELAELKKQQKYQNRGTETALPDLYAIRDRILQGWKVAKRAESKLRLREFADQLIKAVIADDTGYSMMERLLSDLEQERKFSRGGSQTALHWENRYREAVTELHRRGVNWG